MKIEEIASIEPELDPQKFLTLLKKIAERVENGNGNCITLKECTNWGLSEEESVHGLFLLVRSGVLTKKIAVYDEEEDFFDDIKSPDELNDKPIEDIRFWFYPKLKGEEFAPFFCNLPDSPGAEGMNQLMQELEAGDDRG